MSAKRDYAAPPVSRAIIVLRHVAAGRPLANLRQAARDTGIERTTLLRLVRTLEAEGFIEPGGPGEAHRLGAALLELAGQKLFSLDLAREASPVLARLSLDLGLSSHLGVLQRREVIYIVRHAPNLHLVSNVRAGSRLPAHATSVGRIILAQMAPGDVDALFADAPLAPATAKTPVTLAALHRQLRQDRAAGLAESRSYFEAGIDSYAAPVFDHTGAVAGGVNVSGPESAFEGVGRRAAVTAALREAACEISRRMGYSGAPPVPLSVKRSKA